MRRPNTGVLFYNNAELKAIDFSEEIAKVYALALRAGAPRKGDDSLFSLYILSTPKKIIKYLPVTYNVVGYTNHMYLQSTHIYHFTHAKPWTIHPRSPSKTVYIHFAKRWQALVQKRFTYWQLSQYLPILLQQGRSVVYKRRSRSSHSLFASTIARRRKVSQHSRRKRTQLRLNIRKARSIIMPKR